MSSSFSLFALLLGVLCTDSVTPEEIQQAKAVADSSFFFSGKGTPAEYATNMRGQLLRESAILNGKDCGNYAEAVRRLAACGRDAQIGFQWKQKRPLVNVQRLSRKPVIDGHVNAAEWENATLFRGEFQLGESGRNSFTDTEWRIGVYGNSLYVSACFRDAEQHVVSYAPGGSAAPWLGDSLELFIRPSPEELFYYELVINPDGELCTFWHLNNPYGGYTRLQECVNIAQARTMRTADGFSVELELPLHNLHPAWCRKLPVPGSRFDFILIRTNRNTQTYTLSAPVPFLYNGHNIFGYIRGIFPPL